MSKFSFEESAIRVLANFASINPSMLVEPDKLTVMNIPKSIVASYPFEKPYDFDSFGLFDCADFLAVLSVMKKATIEVNDKCLTITADGDKLTYYTTAKNLIQEIPDVNVLFNGSTDQLDFALPADRLAVMNKMVSILKSKYIFFESDGKRVRITIGDELESSSNNYELLIEDGIKTNCLTEPVKISIVDFKVLAGEYNIKIAKKEARGKTKYFSKWDNLNGATYLIGVEA